MAVSTLDPDRIPESAERGRITRSRMKAAYCASIFLASLLLFLLEPITAKSLLPCYGGTAGVWTTSMLFFQTVLLLGYLYAHLLAKLPGKRTAAFIHLGLLAITGIWLLVGPIRPAATPQRPVIGILLSLTVIVGLPFFTVSSTSPLLQHWYAANYRKRFPYWLYSLSNAASLLGLFSFPFVLEPLLDADGFRTTLRIILGVYLLLTALATVAAKASPEPG